MMVAGKSDVEMNVNAISLMFGNNKVLEKGQLYKNYSEQQLKEYMKNDSIKIILEINSGKKKFYLLYNGFYKKIYRY